MKTAMQTSGKKAEAIVRFGWDVGVDGGENVGAGGKVDVSEDGDGANRTCDGSGGDVDNSEDGDDANRADNGAGDGAARRRGRR